MKKSIRLFISILALAFMWAGLVANPGYAQDKVKDAKAAPAANAEKGKSILKELIDNERVRVFEVTFRPGDAGVPNASRPARVVRALKGGALTRHYADGTTERIEFKTGEVRAFEADSKPYTLKNLGRSDVMLYVVNLKEPKK